MREEKLRILKMIAEGKVSPEEGLELIENLEPSHENVQPKGKSSRKMVVVNVVSSDGDKISIKIPLSAIDFIEPFITAYVPGIKDKPDVAEKISHIKRLKDTIADMKGTIVDITSEDGDVIKISIAEPEVETLKESGEE